MMRRITILILSLLILFAAVLLGRMTLRNGAHAPRDDARPLRIVSLSPAMTEALYAMSLGDCLAGVSESCNYPPEAKKLPQVGALGSTNIETLLSLRPTLIVTTDFERDDTMQAIKASGAQVFEGHIATIPQMLESFEKIGQLTGRQSEAAALVQTIKHELAAIRLRFETVSPNQRPRVYMEVWHDPITTIGRNSFLDDVLAQSGGTNAAHEIDQAYPIISAEKVLEWNPDVIVLCDQTRKGRGQALLQERIGWQGIKAVKDRRIIDDLNIDLLIRPGPRLTQGMAQLADRLYPKAQEAAR